MQSVLAEVGANRVPVVEVFNKIDRLTASELARLKALYPDALFISASAATGIEQLTAAMVARLAMDAERIRVTLDDRREADRLMVADLYRHARVVSHVRTDRAVVMEADVPRRLLARYRRARVTA